MQGRLKNKKQKTKCQHVSLLYEWVSRDVAVGYSAIFMDLSLIAFPCGILD